MPNLVFRLRRALRALYLTLAWLAVGVLPNHMSCSQIVQDSLANGTCNFLTTATTNILSLLFLPDWLRGGDPADGDNGNGDPFQPPVQT